MDRSGRDLHDHAYELEIEEQCLQAGIVFDLHHVVVQYDREGIGRVRVNQTNQLRLKQARKALKSSGRLLLRNRQRGTYFPEKCRSKIPQTVQTVIGCDLSGFASSLTARILTNRFGRIGFRADRRLRRFVRQSG